MMCMEEIKTVEKLMRIAKLDLTDAEKKEYAHDLKNILEAFSSIDEAKVIGVEPAFQPLEIKDRKRKDIVEKSLSQEDALANTRNKKDGHFIGPKAM